MDVEVKLFGPMREDVGEKTLVRTLPEGATVADLVENLVADYPVLDGRLLDDEGDIDTHVNVTVNGTNVRQREELATELEDGDVLRTAPQVVGGRE